MNFRPRMTNRAVGWLAILPIAAMALCLLPCGGTSYGAPPHAASQDSKEDDKKTPRKSKGKEPKLPAELKKRLDALERAKKARQAAGSASRGAKRGSDTRKGVPSQGGAKPSASGPRNPDAAASIPKAKSSRVNPQRDTKAGPSKALKIPAVESDIPPEERKYFFSIKDGTYEQLLDAFARMTGLGVIGEAPQGGKVTFVSSEELDYKEALGRVRMLLFNYKPHEPYWIDRVETHLEVSRVNDIYRKIPRERMFKTVEDFRAAHLPGDELALVVYTPKSGSVADLKVVRDFLPDYVRVSPLEDMNSVTIFALVKDIEKYLGLIDFFTITSKDPRTLERIEVTYILPSVAVERLGQLMDLDGGKRLRGSSRPRRGKEISPLDIVPEPEVTLLPDDAQGVLIVRAMQDKIEEIKRLLPYIDVDTSLEGVEPVIIPVEHVEPEQLITTIQQILAAFTGSSESRIPKGKAPSRGKRSGGRPSRAPFTSEGITLLPHPSNDAIVVIAEAEDAKRVRELVEQFDVPGPRVGPVRIEVDNADCDEVANTIKAVLAGAPTPKGAADRLQVVSEPGGKAIWFTGSQKELEKARELVELLDTPGETASLRVLTLRHQQPTFVASMLREFDKDTGGRAPSSKPPRGRKPRTVGASKFTPNDEQGRLFIICTDDEWETYKDIVQQLEEAVEERPLFVRVPVEHISPEEAVDRLTGMLAGGGRPMVGGLVPADGGILVMNATETQLEEIESLLREIDKPIEIIQRTFEIRYRDPSEITAAIETLVVGGSGSKSPRRRPRPDGKGAVMPMGFAQPDVTTALMGNHLIVRATPEKMEEIAELISELDVEETKTELRTYTDFSPQADIMSISEALSSVFSGRTTGSRRKGGQPKGGGGPQFIPQPAAGRLIVIAQREMFEDIEELLGALKTEGDVAAKDVVFIDVAFADPEVVVEQVKPLLDIAVQELIHTGELPPVADSFGVGGQAIKRRPGQIVESSAYYHLASDAINGRIVVAAAPVLVERARKLVAQFDKPREEQEAVFRTVQLAHAGAAEMVKAIKEMIGTSPRATRRRSRVKGVPVPEAPEKTPLLVVEAPGGGAVVLHGLPEDVERAVDWIERLDVLSTTGRAIKVYSVEHADIKSLVELIMNVVDRPTLPSVKGRPPRIRKGVETLEDEEVFETTKTWIGQDIYIQADLIASTMVVAAPEVKMAQIDEIVERFNTPSSEEPSPLTGRQGLPSFEYELKHKEAVDAAFELEMVLEQLWDTPDELPQVESALFGNYLIVKYPHEDRFPEIEEIIRKYVDRPDPKALAIKKKAITAPGPMSASQFALWVKMNHPELNVKIIDKTNRDDRIELEQLRPRERTRVNPCVLPAAFARTAGDVLSSLVGQTAPEKKGGGENEKGSSPAKDKSDEPRRDLLEQAVRRMLENEGKGESDSPPRPSSERADLLEEEAPEITIEVDDTTGDVIFKGPAGVLEDVPEWVKELEEEIEDLKSPPDIRVFRVQYIDVYSAAEILDEMFNATRQQRAAVQAAQRRQQQLLRQQQLRQQRQQQQQGKQPGQQQRPGQRGQQQAQRAAVPQLPEPAVRIYPNPRDRTLILRAQTNQYPAIRELLATIDQPKPIDSELKIFKLEKLNAVEVEEVLKEMLGLDERPPSRVAPARGGRRPGAAAARSRTPSGQLPRTIMQETVSGTNRLGVDPQDIKLSGNEASNTIVVMAPKAAINFIADLIKQLESEEVPERVTKHYELIHADAQEVADYLEEHFLGVPGGGKSLKGGARAGASSAAPRTLNAPSFIPYPRLNLLTVLATQDQLNRIDDLIGRLDVSSDQERWEDVTLVHADAKQVADTLAQMFGSGAGRARGAPKRTGGETSQARFIGEEGGRILLFNAPEGLREQILATIEKLEAEAKDTTGIRVVRLQHATPSKVADAIESAYAGGRRGRAGGQAGQKRIAVTAYDPAKQLFIQADDDAFKEIESLIKMLDKPAEIGFEFRIYRLQYANARQVHTKMSNLITDYLRQLGRSVEREAFSVEVDDNANALIVLGGPAVFGFLEENLPKIDNPANAASPPGYLMVALKNADAQEVAGNITRLWSGRDIPSGQTPPQAEANRSLNTLIVRGTEDQLEEIKKQIIEPLEEQAAPALLMETINLQYADPEAVAESINRIFEDKRRAYQAIPGRSDGRTALEFTVIVTPQINTKQVVVQASARNMSLVKARIAELDREEVAEKIATTIKIYPLKYADPETVAKIINEWSRSRPKPAASGRQGAAADVVNATAETMTRSVVVTAGAANHMIVEGLIEGLDSESTNARELHTRKLKLADAEELARALKEVYKGRRSARGGEREVQITPSQATNSLLIFASKTEMAELDALIRTLDVEPDPARGQLETFRLKYADPWSVQDAVNQLFREGGREPRDRVTVVPEFGSNSVIVSASPQNMKRVEELIAKLDTEEGSRLDVHVINVQNADAGSVAQTLSEIFVRSTPRSRGDQPPPITISALPGSRAVLVKCNNDDFAEIQTVVDQLDTEEAVLGEKVAVVQLLYGDATEVEAALREYLKKPGGRGGSGGELAGDMRLSVLTQSNAVVISGDKEGVERLKELATQLDGAGEKGSVPQIIKLQHASAGQLAPMLEEMFAEQRSGRRSQTPPVIVSNDAIGALIVRASPTDFAAIEAVVQKLDTEEAALQQNFRIVQVGGGVNVEDMAAKVEEAINEGARAQAVSKRGGDVPSIRVTPDKRTVSLIISGSPELFDQAEKMTQALEKLGPPGGKGTKIIRLANTPAEDIERLIALLKGEESKVKSRSRRGGGRRPAGRGK